MKVFFTYQGTRVNFNGTNGSYAGLIHSVNGTGGGTGGRFGRPVVFCTFATGVSYSLKVEL